MLMQSVEEATEAPAPRPVFVANKLAKVGDYAQAKALLDTVDLNTDETAAMIYIMVLDKMHAQAAKQDAVQSLIGLLEYLSHVFTAAGTARVLAGGADRNTPGRRRRA
jgi:hypothetical protein